ncbi:hypothetical protein BDR03DRAFT_987360 [Suillus americanus]|nr:hypothetical protein BDR03DRAFT_987360 [Suillus americanus]
MNEVFQQEFPLKSWGEGSASYSYTVGKFNSKEWSWLVIWEAGLVVEMPALTLTCVFVCTNGALPTEENSSPLDGGDGRGSTTSTVIKFAMHVLSVGDVRVEKLVGLELENRPLSTVLDGRRKLKWEFTLGSGVLVVKDPVVHLVDDWAVIVKL